MVGFVRWLRRDRWFVDDKEQAINSPFVFGDAADGRYGTSLLGVLNGLLRQIGLCVVAYVHHDEPVRPWLGLRRWAS